MGLSYDRGRQGEDLALRYLEKAGYCLVKRNYRIRREKALSEIDLIVLALEKKASSDFRQLYIELQQVLCGLDLVATWEEQCGFGSNVLHLRDTLLEQAAYFLSIVFVEVKYWKAYPLADLSYNLSLARQKRMLETAECFLQAYPPFAKLKPRFDLFLIQGANASCSHIEAAFP